MADHLHRIEKTCRMYRAGIFCPAELWNLVVAAIYDLPIAATLNELPPSVQAELRAIYAERPGSLTVLDDEHPIRTGWAAMSKEFGNLYAPTYALESRLAIEEWLKSMNEEGC